MGQRPWATVQGIFVKNGSDFVVYTCKLKIKDSIAYQCFPL